MAFHPVTGVLYASVGAFQPVHPDGIATIDKNSGAATILGTTAQTDSTSSTARQHVRRRRRTKRRSIFMSPQINAGTGTGRSVIRRSAVWVELVVDRCRPDVGRAPPSP
jgi:hypothetical protein